MADSLAREITRRGFLVKIGQGQAAANVAHFHAQYGGAAIRFRPARPETRLGHRRPWQPFHGSANRNPLGRGGGGSTGLSGQRL